MGQTGKQGSPRGLTDHTSLGCPGEKLGCFWCVILSVYLFFREKGHLIESVRETAKEAVVNIQAAWKGIIGERVSVLSPQYELAELAGKPSVSLFRASYL